VGEPLLSQIRALLASELASSPFGPATPDAIGAAESALGFSIPRLLRSIYLHIGNGGFGPGRGGKIIGVAGGYASDLGTLVGTYKEVQEGSRFLGVDWKRELLPFCAWGCNIFSCVDCSELSEPVYLSVECRPSQQGYGLSEFLRMWVEGSDILGYRRSEVEEVEILNPFTGERTRVSSPTEKTEKGKKGDALR
jgi:hypothetical protein